MTRLTTTVFLLALAAPVAAQFPVDAEWRERLTSEDPEVLGAAFRAAEKQRDDVLAVLGPALKAIDGASEKLFLLAWSALDAGASRINAIRKREAPPGPELQRKIDDFVQKVEPLALSGLGDEKDYVRWVAARILGMLAHEEGHRPIVEKALCERLPRATRQEIGTLVWAIGIGGMRHVDKTVLVRFLTHERTDVRVNASWALRFAGPEDVDIIAPLVEALAEKNDNALSNIVGALENIGVNEATVRGIVDALAGKTPERRRGALWLLEPMLKALDTYDTRLDPLLEVLGDALSEPELRYSVIFSIGHLRERGLRFMPQLRALAEKPADADLWALAWTFGALGVSHEQRDFLFACLKQENESVVWNAAWALESLGTEAARAMPELRGALSRVRKPKAREQLLRTIVLSALDADDMRLALNEFEKTAVASGLWAIGAVSDRQTISPALASVLNAYLVKHAAELTPEMVRYIAGGTANTEFTPAMVSVAHDAHARSDTALFEAAIRTIFLDPDLPAGLEPLLDHAMKASDAEFVTEALKRRATAMTKAQRVHWLGRVVAGHALADVRTFAARWLAAIGDDSARTTIALIEAHFEFPTLQEDDETSWQSTSMPWSSDAQREVFLDTALAIGHGDVIVAEILTYLETCDGSERGRAITYLAQASPNDPKVQAAVLAALAAADEEERHGAVHALRHLPPSVAPIEKLEKLANPEFEDSVFVRDAALEFLIRSNDGDATMRAILAGAGVRSGLENRFLELERLGSSSTGYCRNLIRLLGASGESGAAASGLLASFVEREGLARVDETRRRLKGRERELADAWMLRHDMWRDPSLVLRVAQQIDSDDLLLATLLLESLQGAGPLATEAAQAGVTLLTEIGAGPGPESEAEMEILSHFAVRTIELVQSLGAHSTHIKVPDSQALRPEHLGVSVSPGPAALDVQRKSVPFPAGEVTPTPWVRDVEGGRTLRLDAPDEDGTGGFYAFARIIAAEGADVEVEATLHEYDVGDSPFLRPVEFESGTAVLSPSGDALLLRLRVSEDRTVELSARLGKPVDRRIRARGWNLESFFPRLIDVDIFGRAESLVRMRLLTTADEDVLLQVRETLAGIAPPAVMHSRQMPSTLFYGNREKDGEFLCLLGRTAGDTQPRLVAIPTWVHDGVYDLPAGVSVDGNPLTVPVETVMRLWKAAFASERGEPEQAMVVKKHVETWLAKRELFEKDAPKDVLAQQAFALTLLHMTDARGVVDRLRDALLSPEPRFVEDLVSATLASEYSGVLVDAVLYGENIETRNIVARRLWLVDLEPRREEIHEWLERTKPTETEFLTPSPERQKLEELRHTVRLFSK